MGKEGCKFRPFLLLNIGEDFLLIVFHLLSLTQKIFSYFDYDFLGFRFFFYVAETQIFSDFRYK